MSEYVHKLKKRQLQVSNHALLYFQMCEHKSALLQLCWDALFPEAI